MADCSDISTCSQLSLIEGKLTEAVILMRTRGEKLESINKVNLWGLGISDASIMRKMPNLRIVSLRQVECTTYFQVLSTNLLCSLDPFSHCFHLQELYLRSNQIGDIHQIAHLKFLPKLQKLWLDNNPCCESQTQDLYRFSVIRNVMTLTHLDLKAITSEELSKCETHGILLTAPPPSTDLAPSDPEVSQVNSVDSALDNDATQRLETSSTKAKTDVDTSELIHIPENGKNEAENKQSPDQSVTATKPEEAINNVTVDSRTQSNGTESATSVSSSNVFDVHEATLVETNKIRQEYGLTPLKKSKISPPVRSLQSPTGEHERLIRNAVFRLLRTLNSRSLEMVIHAAERQLYRLEQRRDGRNQVQRLMVDENWTENSNYDYTNYLDNTL